MRSILVHLKNASKSEVIELLNTITSKPNGSTGVDWLIASEKDDPVLYIGFYNDYEEFEPEDWNNLLAILGNKPSVSIYADISGRHSGTEEVFTFVERVLTKFDGVAQDDYTDHCWTIEEIKQKSEFQNHPFFDYQGWYSEDQSSD